MLRNEANLHPETPPILSAIVRHKVGAYPTHPSTVTYILNDPLILLLCLIELFPLLFNPNTVFIFCDCAVHARRKMQSYAHVSKRAKSSTPAKNHRDNIAINRAIAHSTAAMLETVTVCFQNSVLSCSILNQTFCMLQQQGILYCTNLGLHVQFQMAKSNCTCRQGGTCKLTLLHHFLPGMH